MKVSKICTNYQFCFVFVCIPVLQVGHGLSIILYPSASTGVLEVLENFLCICVGTFLIMWTRGPL